MKLLARRRLASKGRLVLPDMIRRLAGFQAGDEVYIHYDIERDAVVLARRSLDSSPEFASTLSANPLEATLTAR